MKYGMNLHCMWFSWVSLNESAEAIQVLKNGKNLKFQLTHNNNQQFAEFVLENCVISLTDVIWCAGWCEAGNLAIFFDGNSTTEIGQFQMAKPIQ